MKIKIEAEVDLNQAAFPSSILDIVQLVDGALAEPLRAAKRAALVEARERGLLSDDANSNLEAVLTV